MPASRHDVAKSPVTSITSSHVEGFLNVRMKNKVAPKTVVVDIKTLNVAFNRAERYSVILKNPVTAVELPKVESSGGAHGLSESFGRIVKNAGIDSQKIQGKGTIHFNRLTFHSLRHSFNSAMAEAGVSQEIRMRLTGHSSFGMNTRYTHNQ